MGTTQRIIPGVTGEPNWGNLNIAITAIANTIEKEQDVGEEAEKAVEKEKEKPSDANKKAVKNINALQNKLYARRSNHFKSALQNLIRTGGGRGKITKGKSASLGKAGLRTATKFSGFVAGVHSVGLAKALNNIGFGSLKGKKIQEVIDFLLVFFADTSSGMDEVAANMASCEILQMLTVDIKSVEDFEKKLQSLVEDNSLTEVLCNFYGIYLFEPLSQRFQEKITQIKGEAVSAETFKIIKEDILGQLRVLKTNKELLKIDWKGKEGKDLEEKIFNSIIQIFE